MTTIQQKFREIEESLHREKWPGNMSRNETIWGHLGLRDHFTRRMKLVLIYLKSSYLSFTKVKALKEILRKA